MKPLVCCTLLTADRQAFTDRAVKSFLGQTYEPRDLLIFDTGAQPYMLCQLDGVVNAGRRVTVLRLEREQQWTIGHLRNMAVEAARNAEIIAHWDSDDWSAPERLAQQVELLWGRPAVGYREMLFWKAESKTRIYPAVSAMPNKPPLSAQQIHVMRHGYVKTLPGEAWLYSVARTDRPVGTSLMYWRKTWENHRFPELNAGEDLEWCKAVEPFAIPGFRTDVVDKPTMVAEVHGGNTHLRIQSEVENWKRVPEWDARLAEIMRL